MQMLSEVRALPSSTSVYFLIFSIIHICVFPHLYGADPAMADCPFERMVLVENRLGGFWEEPGVLGGCTSSAVCAYPTPKPQAPWIMDKIMQFCLLGLARLSVIPLRRHFREMEA